MLTSQKVIDAINESAFAEATARQACLRRAFGAASSLNLRNPG